MRAMILIHFPGTRSFSPERQSRYLAEGLPAFAEVRFPSVTADRFDTDHVDRQVEFRGVMLPEAAMMQALQTGNVNIVWNSRSDAVATVWKVQTSVQEDDNTLTLTCEREKDYTPPPATLVQDGEPVTAGGDVIEIDAGASNG